MTILGLQTADALPFFDWTADTDTLGAILVSFFTLAVFSFLYKDNPFYKIAEHVFVGAGTAYFALQYYQEGILEPVYEHLQRAAELGRQGELIELGGHAVSPELAIIFRSFALILSLMLASRLFFPNGWAARWPLAIMIGVYAALKMTGETQSKFVLMIKGAIHPWATSGLSLGEWWNSPIARIEETVFFQNFAYAVFLIGLLATLAHFMFTFRRSRAFSSLSRIGIITLMITFGSMFGFTVLGRIALLIERVDTLGQLTEPQYSFAGDSPLLSPPWIIALLMILSLFLMRGGTHTGDEAS
ncbi:MAG: hypothetical protein VX916_01300 [Planctomycetota bacterium]|nr:hypothetical protein [Planctomycetota bacterium]